MEYFSIGSGSSGNCAYIGTDNGCVLLDAGISGKRTKEAFYEKGIDPNNIDAILITHEHRDHVSCLGVLARQYNIPIFATKSTIKSLFNNINLGEIRSDLFKDISPGEVLKFNNLKVEPFSVMHDAVDPVGYLFFEEDKSLAIVTDLGCYDEKIIEKLVNLDAIVLESNHDLRMLEAGVYPYQLKRRIASKYGHLSNEDCGRLLSKVLHDNMKWIVLAHLSAENNYDRLALESVGLEITMADNKYRSKDFEISIAPRNKVSITYRI